MTCSDVMEVLLTSYEKKKKYKTTIVILHQQLTDTRMHIDSLEHELRAAHNRPLVSESTQTVSPLALRNASSQASPVLQDTAAQASPPTCKSRCQASPPPPSSISPPNLSLHSNLSPPAAPSPPCILRPSGQAHPHMVSCPPLQGLRPLLCAWRSSPLPLFIQGHQGYKGQQTPFQDHIPHNLQRQPLAPWRPHATR